LSPQDRLSEMVRAVRATDAMANAARG
jgi:hypothetical protein